MGSDETWLQNYSISGLYERLRADAGQYPDTIAAFFGSDNTKARESLRKDLAEKFRRAQECIVDIDLDDKLHRLAIALKAEKNGVNPFHWELEFPELIQRKYPGFDAFVGNPPFLSSTMV
jgi:hypothetical protein